ncbi:hypothetical protein CK203_100932 [Vitis vinifera]|uniref:Retrotransposon gag domain-containing protein n=1 Tax=Vitis vinifera TaxID=29760 RepID=A0A438CJH5_VITVI|nr:hypothetical protein CK203_100932 [Vitis vinifera]
MSPRSPKAYQVLAILENPTLKSPPRGSQGDFTSSSLLAKTTELCILALGTFPGNLSSKELETPKRAAKLFRNTELSSQGYEVGFHLEVPSSLLAAWFVYRQKEKHLTVQKCCEITSQQKGDFATLCKMLPSARSDWLVMAATSSFQLRIAHRLKHWIVDFLSFEMVGLERYFGPSHTVERRKGCSHTIELPRETRLSEKQAPLNKKGSSRTITCERRSRLGWMMQASGVGTPPPDDTWRASLSGATPSGLPKEGHPATARVLSPAERSEQVLLHHPDSLPQPTFRCLQSERTGMMASHLPRSLTAVYRMMMTLPPPRGIMTSQKVFPSLKRELHGSSGCKASTLAPSVGRSLIQSPAKMSTPSRSRSSARGEEDNTEWRQAIERRQLASERQTQALLQETLSRGQVANSRLDPESIYPRTTGAIPETCNVRPQERHTPIHQTPHEENSNSTHFSSKRQRDKRSQLLSTMRARLGPQEPGRPRSLVATTWEAHPDPMVTPLVQNVPSHPDTMSLLWCRMFPAPSGTISWEKPPKRATQKRRAAMQSIPRQPTRVDHLMENESLREFVKRFGQAVLQVEAYSIDVVLQIFKRNIYPSTPFFESPAKKPPMTMDDLFRRASKYSMLEDDVRAATQQILVAGQASRSGAERSAKIPDRPRSFDRRREEQSCPEQPSLTPFSISYEKLLAMIHDMSDFRWPGSFRTDPSKRDHSKKCTYHKEHGHTTEMCRSLHYLVKKLIRAGHLKQYLCSDARGRDASQNHNSETPRVPTAPKAIINYINGDPLDEEYDYKRKKQRLLREASVRERVNSIRPGITRGGPSPHKWDNHFPTSRPHKDIAAAPRRPHPVPRDRRLRRETHPS